MHMADALLSPAVGLTMSAVSAAAVAYSVKKTKKTDLCDKKIPVMGVMGAFVFAAQMINFIIPATGSSGHIGGGILLAAMIGSYPALISISAVLIIQSLLFADGGILALGCTIFNLGVIPCLIIYPLIFKPLVKKGMTAGTITLASIFSVVAALQLGAFGVVMQTTLSGITELPFVTFLLFMQPIHLAIGIAEGIITAAVLCFVYKIRPEIMESTFDRTAIKSGIPMKHVLVTLAVAAILAGGFLSLYASSLPDGLEWAIEKITGSTELAAKESSVIEGVASIQETTSFMPDYNFRNAGEDSSGAGTAIAGIAGCAVTFLFAWAVAVTISAVRKKRRSFQDTEGTGSTEGTEAQRNTSREKQDT
ncbi:MAG: energy-coupling factor ABC transporter permease [Treponema sp.]|nr:energy-coupling factor ABC transporter permease [Treponema sp.]